MKHTFNIEPLRELLTEEGLPHPDPDQEKAIASFLESKSKLKQTNLFKVKACAGSGKTLLIVYTVIVLITQMDVDPDSIVVLAFNRKIADEINQRLRDALKKDKHFRVAYTFHSFATRFLGTDLVKPKAFTTASPLYSTNLASLVQSRLIDVKYLYDANFKALYDQLDSYIPKNSTRRAVAYNKANTSLSILLDSLGISASKKKRVLFNCDSSTFRQNPKLLRDYTIQGDALNYANLTASFKSMIAEIANRLTCYGIIYDLELEPLSATSKDYVAIISINTPSRKTAYIEIYSNTNTQSRHYNALLLNANSKVPPTKWDALAEINEPSPFKDLDKFLSDADFCDLRHHSLKELEHSAFLSRRPDEVTEQLLLTCERLRNERLCTSATAKAYVHNLRNNSTMMKIPFIEVLSSLIDPIFNIYGYDGQFNLNIVFQTYARMLECQVERNIEKELPIDYLFVDESQDISALFRELLKIIIGNNIGIRAMFVGDSMQAINRFAGGNTHTFENLATAFGINKSKVEELELTTTYRLPTGLVNIANVFTVSNDDTLGLYSKMKSVPTNKGGLCRYYIIENKDPTGELLSEELLQNLETIIANAWTTNPDYSIAILGRKRNLGVGLKLSTIHSMLINRLKSTGKYKWDSILAISLSTIHQYKGKEADVVITLDIDHNSFPLESSMKEVNEVLFRENKTTLNIDNRCLFYVAITRAKHELHLIGFGTECFYITDINDRGEQISAGKKR